MRAWRERLGGRRDDGAAAVEFALVSPLLFVIVFGVLQFGYGLFELQAAQATVTNTVREVSRGVTGCTGGQRGLDALTRTATTNNGFRPHQDVTGDYQVSMRVTPAIPGNPASPGDPIQVTITYKPQVQLFFVPYPNKISRSAGGTVEAVAGPGSPITCPVMGVPK